MLASFFGDPYIRLTQKTGMDRSDRGYRLRIQGMPCSLSPGHVQFLGPVGMPFLSCDPLYQYVLFPMFP